ncbi:MAG TPA: TonB C-terminal domain-containing protein, partial [Bdellovibrionota bacterium]|nr:TonB C-terminal domain-containing protein [Bdellovibrionota bacterium]
DSQGVLKNLHIQQSSGNEEFDKLAESAIYASNPFEPPPLDLRSLLKRGILIKIVSSEEVP